MTIIDPGTDNVDTARPTHRRRCDRPVRHALCCECGNLRTTRGNPRNYLPDNPREAAHGRMLEDLKCTPCAKVTRHAILRGDNDPYRDHAEALNAVREGLIAGAVRTLESLGMRVRLEEFTLDDGRTGSAEIIRFLDDGATFVTLNPAVHHETVMRRARDIATRIKEPDEAKWFIGVTDDGFPYATVAWAAST